MGASESKEGMCGGECDIERVCDTKKSDRIVTVGKVRGVEASGMRDRSPRNLQKQQQQQQQHAHPQQQANQEIPNNVLAMESNGHEAKTYYSGAHIGSNPAMISSWRYSTEEEAVGVGCYFGRIDGQTDSVTRVKNIVSGGPAEQCGVIHVGDALVSVDDHHVYGAPLCEIGKHVLGQSGTFVKLQFERPSGEGFSVELMRGKGVLTCM